jgi:hypothetical protein
MIGTTDELVKACEKAHQRAQSLESADKKTIQMRWYVRVNAGAMKTETLIAIATKQYWKTDKLLASWKELFGGDAPFCQLLNVSKSSHVDNETTMLTEMIRTCHAVKGWITP